MHFQDKQKNKGKTLICSKYKPTVAKKDPLEMKDLERKSETQLHRLFNRNHNFHKRILTIFELLKPATESIIERTLTRPKRFFSTTTTTTKHKLFLIPNS